MKNNTHIHKGSWFKSIIKHGKWYLFASLLTKGMNFYLLPIYTNYIDPNDYGILNSLLSIARLMPIFLSLALDSAFIRFYHDRKESPKKLQELFSSIFWFVMAFGGGGTLLAISSSYFWAKDFFQVDIWPYMVLTLGTPIFFQIGQLGIVFLRQSLQSRKTAMLEFLWTILNIAFTLVLLVGLKMGFLSNLVGRFAASFILFVYYVYYFYKEGLLVWSISKKLLRECLIFSIPLVPTIAGGWIAGFTDRLVIAKYLDFKATGLYSLGFQLGMLLYFFHDAITQVLSPISMSGLIHDKERIKAKIVDFSLFLWGFMLLADLGLFLFAKELVVIFTEKSYHESFIVIPIIGFSYVLGAQYRFFNSIIQYHKKNWIISVGAILNATVNLGLNIIFVPIYGYVAAAVTTIASTAAYVAWIILWSRKFEKIKLRYRKTFLLTAIFGISVWFASEYLYEEISINNIVLKTLLLTGISVIFVYITGNLKFVLDIKDKLLKKIRGGK